jgi:hypothetical protein
MKKSERIENHEKKGPGGDDKLRDSLPGLPHHQCQVKSLAVAIKTFSSFSVV